MGGTDALEAVAIISDGKVVDLIRKIALVAADLSVELKQPMGDHIIRATARVHCAALWARDKHFKDIERVKYIENKPKNGVRQSRRQSILDAWAVAVPQGDDMVMGW